jgi:hypothetical protein
MTKQLYGVFEGVDWRGARHAVTIYCDSGACVMVDDQERSYPVPMPAARLGQDGLAKEVACVFDLRGVEFRSAPAASRLPS